MYSEKRQYKIDGSPIQTHFHFGGGPAPVLVGKDTPQAYYLGAFHVNRVSLQDRLRGRYYDNYLFKMASRAPFPIIAVSKALTLVSLSNDVSLRYFRSRSNMTKFVDNSSIAMITGEHPQTTKIKYTTNIYSYH